jgi:multidrug efflux system outer membrane protein
MLDSAAERVGLVGPESDKASTPVSSQAAVERSPWSFDPLLVALLQASRQNSPDLQAARARLDAARAVAGFAARGLAPAGGVSAQLSESQLSVTEADPYDQGSPRPPRRQILQAGLAVRWELDLFGRVGTAQAIAARGVDAEAAALAGAEALLDAEIVRLYALRRERQWARRSLAEALRLSEQRKRDTAERLAGGLAEPPELWQIEAEHAALRAEQAAAEAELQAARAQLLAAVGLSPLLDHPLRERLEASAEPGALPDLQDYALPPDFLDRRPDVRMAEARLRAAMGETVFAERASWPSLTLLGSLASVALPGQFGEAATRSLGIGPALEWNWLSFGRNRLREAAAQAGEQALAAEFEATVLRAVADADGAARAWYAARSGWEEAVDAARLAEQAHLRMQKRVDAGLDARVLGLGAALELRAAERRAVQAWAEALAAYAALKLALGVDTAADDGHA